MSTTPPYPHPMQLLPILLGSFLSGAIASVSILAIPVLLETNPSPSNTQYLQEWNRVYHRGHIIGPAISIITSALYGIQVFATSSPGFGAAAVLTMGMISYTWIFMTGTNKKLFEAVEGKDVEEGEVEELVKRWRTLNFGRALFPLSGAVVATLGICGRL